PFRTSNREVIVNERLFPNHCWLDPSDIGSFDSSLELPIRMLTRQNWSRPPQPQKENPASHRRKMHPGAPRYERQTARSNPASKTEVDRLPICVIPPSH